MTSKNLPVTVAFWLTAVTGLWGQGITTASINGLVTDQKGDPLPGASVIAVHAPSGSKYGVVTRTDGRYTIPGVRVGGPYTISITFVGYEEQKRGIDYLSLGQNYTANFRMGEAATQLSEIQVTAEQDPLLNSDRTGAATNVRQEQFERLPSITRSFQDMTSLSPQSGPGFSFGGRSNLYNNFTIDGATSNNVFGLTALPGGQTNAQPVSLDAIQEMTVSNSPFDVRQGTFTGAGVNVVTRSGTNEFTGSVYGFSRSQALVGTKIAGTRQPNTDFNYKNYGFRLGGPLIRDKLFFFVNYEGEQSINPAVTNPVNTGTDQPTAITNTSDPNYGSATNLARLSAFLLDPSKGWTYDPGTYNNFNVPTQSTKYLAKLDWNIDTSNKLSFKFNGLNSFRDIPPSNSGGIGSAPVGGRQNSVNAIPFSHSWYRQFNNLNSFILELNSSVGSGYSNKLTLGYSAFRDFRQQGGGGTPPNFPTVDILGPNGNNMTTFGPDPFTPNNRINQNLYQISDNFSVYRTNNIVTLGTSLEFFQFKNIFTQQINGVYQYSSIDNFIANANPATASVANAPTQYLLNYSAVAGNPTPGAVWSAEQLGFYIQDEWEGIKNLTVTTGFRVDVPVFPTKLPQNPVTDGMYFVNNQQINVGLLPKTTPLLSPRFGFNWDVLGDKTFHIRGGSGVFTGRIPFVWISNQVSNNGLLFGSVIDQGTSNTPNFSPTPLPNPGGPSPQFSINATTRGFRFPQVWRTDFAFDKSLPWGLIGTFEALITKDINAVYVYDANLVNPFLTVAGDGRAQFPATIASNTASGDQTLVGRRINQNITQALVLANSSKGYQWSITTQLQKSFAKGFYASAAYTYMDARDVNSQTASTASSLFTGYPTVGSPNNTVLSYSSNYYPSHLIISGSYRKEYAKNFASTLSMIYTGASGSRFSYTYSGDVNSDGNSSNDLIYIPRNESEILLTTSGPTDTRTVDQIWTQLNNYITQDKYLSNHRGQYAARNGAVAPWTNLLNLRFLQDFYIDTEKGKRNTLQFSFEMINVLNLIDSNLGLVKTPARPALLQFVGYEDPAVTTPNTQTNPLLPSNSYTTTLAGGRPVFRFATNPNGTPLSDSFVNNNTSLSRWQLQFGLRYIFN